MTSVESKAETWKGTEELPQQGVAESTVELLELLDHVQGGRMEEQRCLFDPKKISCTQKHMDATNPVTSQQVVSGSDQVGQGKTAAENETDRLCNMVSRVQGSRMDEQRCSAPQIRLAPGSPPPPGKAHSRPASPATTHSSQGPPRSASLSPTPDKEQFQRDGLQTTQQAGAPCAVEQEQFFSMLSHVQRGRMEEQRCVFDPNKRSPGTPKHTDVTNTVPIHSSPADIDQLFSLLASTQGRRLDDQRVSLNLLPGLQVVSGSDQDGQGKSVSGKDTVELCNMVSRVQGSRMDEQRCSAPQIRLAPGSPPPPRKAHSRPASPATTPSSQGPPRSASLSPTPDKEQFQRDGLQTVLQAGAPCTVEQEQFFSLLSHVQRGRMEEQRCVFDPNKKSVCAPKHTDATNAALTHSSPADIDQLFSLLASTQGRRLDDQRVSLNLLPGLQVVSGSDQDGQGKSVSGKETVELCNMVSRVQQAGAPCAVEQEQFFSLLSHVQRGRMEEQRCVFDPNKRSPGTPKHSDATNTVPIHSSPADIDQLFSLLASTQGRRLDDQRVSLNLLPGLQVVSGSDQDGQGKSVSGKETAELCNMVSRVQGCRIDEQRCSLPAALSPGPPRSASMGAVALDSALARQGHLLSAPDLALPRKARSNPSSPSRATPRNAQSGLTSPSGATPRKSRSRPNSPSRAKPKKARSRPSSPSQTTPRKARPRPSSPSRGMAKNALSRPLSPNTVQLSSPISPDEDWFSLIHRIHTSQLQMGEADKGAQGSDEVRQERGGEKRGRGEGGKREGKKGVEEMEKRRTEEVRKEKKGGGRKK